MAAVAATTVSPLCNPLFSLWMACAMLRIWGCLTKEGVEGSPPVAVKMELVDGGGGGVGGLGDEGEGLPPGAVVVCSGGRGETIIYQKKVKRVRNVSHYTKMNHCSICNQDFSRRDVMLRHMRNVHANVKDTDPLKLLDISSSMTFIHPFSMVPSDQVLVGKLDGPVTDFRRLLYLLRHNVPYGVMENDSLCTKK